MRRRELQFSVAAMIGLIACLALNFWLFRVGFVWGIIGANFTKHIGVAVLCQALGVNRRPTDRNSIHPVSTRQASLNGSP